MKLFRQLFRQAVAVAASVCALILAGSIFTLCGPAIAGVEEVYGTWKLVSNQIKILDTGEIRDFEPGVTLSGYITYGADGRMMGLLVRGNRPKAESVGTMTDQQRVDLFKTMVAYGGTYELLDGSTMHHHIDIS